MSTETASVWYSLHTLLLIWILWVFLYRDYRTDVLVSTLTAIDWEIAEGPGGAESDNLRVLVRTAEKEAARLTTTRLLLAWLAAGHAAAGPEEETKQHSLAGPRERFILAVATHARLLMLARGARGFAAVRIAVASLNTVRLVDTSHAVGPR